MSLRTLTILSVLIATASQVFAQAPNKPTYEKMVYINGDGDIFVQKSLPMYLKFSTEPNGTNYDLKGKNPAYSEPMYLDTEGPNYVRSKWAVDPKTGRTVQPQQEVLYEVFADGLAPRTSLKFENAPRYSSGGTVFYGKGLTYTLTPRDGVSGVKQTQHALGGGFSDYSSSVSAGKEGAQSLYYYSVDFVGNAEDTKSSDFTVDLTAPKTSYEIVGINKGGTILSPTAKLKLTSTDNLSGVRTTYYTFDGKNARGYYGPVSTAGLSDGEHTLKYYAVDNVKNMEGGEGGAGASTFKFYLDKIPPVPTHQVKGDQHQGNYLYISSRTTISLAATDNKAGVKNIYYRIDGGERGIFSSDFKMPANRGTHNVKYDANDQVDNLSGNHWINVFMDVDAPETGIIYANPQFVDRDTLFITSKSGISLRFRDDASGVKTTQYQIDGGGFKTYGAFNLPSEGYHTIDFKSTDNVNNAEGDKHSSAYVDNTAPEIFVKFSIEKIGTKGGLPVYPNYTRMYVAATDKKVGTKEIRYSMDGGALTLYSSPQTLDASELSRFRKNKKYKVKVVAKDMLGNESEKEVEFYVGKDAK
ncbi:MAG: hypothetical protein HN728_03240 [Flavobacteriales bacterium]|jgi:hypothetical protein|nr:hypothetical protein [Flavobacteriales bacterium]MBT4705704.1 hypothetical protein [Flavobacteriales bacterium]MBT4930980.1 hypothetical protein [Flavobacteriales bacterium]MBT5132681.1 hypothetical protein [Flavobacteriales bacterium]MBT5977131.1 hypothetical protein [Flavobacteriales bacterium]